jgi:large subunit ribosomal protein L25
MSELVTLNVERRKVSNSRASKKLRRNGYIPASISCRGKESISVALKADELKKNLSSYGRNALFNLSLDKDNPIVGMVKEIQLSPIKREMMHVDLQQVLLDQEIKTNVSVKLKGLDVLEFNKLIALLQLDEIRVKGLPQDIPDEITVDVSKVDKVESINVADIKFPEGIVPEISPEQCVVSIVEAKMEEDIDENAETGESEDAETAETTGEQND